MAAITLATITAAIRTAAGAVVAVDAAATRARSQQPAREQALDLGCGLTSQILASNMACAMQEHDCFLE